MGTFHIQCLSVNYSQSESGFDGIRIIHMIIRQSPYFLDMIPGFDVLCFFGYITYMAGIATDFQRIMKLCEFFGFSLAASTLLTAEN